MHETLTLPNGVRIVFEHMPGLRSASFGIFVGVGSRNEPSSDGGSAHFIEHMLFKSTKHHSAQELSYIMDGIGGQINAYTTREQTCFYAKVLDTHLGTAIDLLCEMFFDCAFDEEEVKSERGIIFEEIGMYEDTPDDACYERLMSACYRGALGRPVLGKTKHLNAMTGASLRQFKDSHYTAGNIVLSLCGSFGEAHILQLSERFSLLKKTKAANPRRAVYTPHTAIKRRRTEQNQLCLGFPSICVTDERRFAMNLFSTLLGGGVSSRLFQNIREKHGLCYSIYCFQSVFSDCGMFSVAAGVNRETELKTIGLICDELRSLIDDGVTQAELDRAREQAKSSLVMGLESSSSRMLKLGNAMQAHNKCVGTDELLECYDAVTKEEIHSLAQEIFHRDQLSISVLGKAKDESDYLNAIII